MPKPYTPNDTWSRKAQAEGYRARSVYKLQELDERFRLFAKARSVLDLGACPGSWLQYVTKNVHGTIIGVDVQPIEPIDGVKLFQEDITDLEALNKIFIQEGVKKFDVIISDLAPKTSGVKDVDQWRSIELSNAVLDVAHKFLHPNGTVVMKVFRGSDFDEWFTDVKTQFEFSKVVIVKASRDRSREVYVVCSRP